MASSPSFQLPSEMPVRLALAAQLTGIPESSLREKVMRGDIPGKRDGPKLIMVRLSDITAWFESLNDVQTYNPTKTEAEAPTKGRRDSRTAAKRTDSLPRPMERPTRLRLSKEDL